MEVEKLLKQCKFSRRHQGYYALRECIRIVLADENRLLYISGIYYDVADILNVSFSAVERNIRTARDYSWRNGGKEQFEKLAGGNMDGKPTVSEVIEIMACYIKEHPDEEEL